MLMTEQQIKLFKQAIKDGVITVVGFDLETSPSKFWGWGTGEQYVDAKQLVNGTETKVITAQFKKYLVDKKSKYLMWDWDGVNGGNDESLVDEIIRILNSADIVIGQNSKQFDVKVLQERAKVLRLPPINIDFMIDTLTSSRSSFKAMSHRLDYRSKQYGLGGKHKMEMQDWIDIVEGRTSPEKKMVPYGLKDNDDTETMFWRELPYYNLPKATVSKILKLIGGGPTLKFFDRPITPKKPFCPYCDKRQQRKFDVIVTETELTCNRCTKSFPLNTPKS